MGHGSVAWWFLRFWQMRCAMSMNPLAILAGVGLLFGLGSSEIRRFERDAAADIRSRLSGDERKVDVRAELAGLAGLWGELRSGTIRASDFSTEGLPLFTEPERRQNGRLGLLRLDLREFVLSGLRVERLEAEIPNCRYDFDLALRHRKIRLSRSGVGTGTVVLREKDLEDFILRKYAEIKRVSVRIDKDRVFVEGYGEFLIAKTNFTVIADLEAVEGTRLFLTDAKIYFDWGRADEPARKALLDTLNPVVDLRKDLGLYDAVSIERIRLRDGRLQAWGSTRIPVRPPEEER